MNREYSLKSNYCLLFCAAKGRRKGVVCVAKGHLCLSPKWLVGWKLSREVERRLKYPTKLIWVNLVDCASLVIGLALENVAQATTRQHQHESTFCKVCYLLLPPPSLSRPSTTITWITTHPIDNPFLVLYPRHRTL